MADQTGRSDPSSKARDGVQKPIRWEESVERQLYANRINIEELYRRNLFLSVIIASIGVGVLIKWVFFG